MHVHHPHKYTDRDVRERFDDLHPLACSFVRAYSGDFEFLRDAQLLLKRDGYLTNGVLRGVLNCMRVDARWATALPAPVEPQETPVAPVLRLVPPKPERPLWRSLRATWRGTYLVSMHRHGRVTHLLDPKRSTVRLVWPQWALQVHPVARCGWVNARTGALLAEEPDRRRCPRCWEEA